MQAIIDKSVYGEKSGDYNRDEDGIEGTEMTCDEKEFQIQISYREAFCMFSLLIHVSDISEIDHKTLFTIKEKVEAFFISYKEQTSIKNFFS